MNRRLLPWIGGSLLVLLACGAWIYVAELAKIAEVSLAAMQQPREEILLQGYVRNVGAPPFSLETLLIEEPNKQPYKRQVSLDANRRFELALGKPVSGAYVASIFTRSPKLLGGTQEQWFKSPALIVVAESQPNPQAVSARQYDERFVTGFAVVVLAAAATLALCTRSRSRTNGPPSPEVAQV